MAAGAAWRRVQEWDRPMLWLEMHHFQPPPQSWTGLEHAEHWDLPEADLSFHDYMNHESSAGGIEAHFYPHCGSDEDEQLELYDVVWRVAARRQIRHPNLTVGPLGTPRIEECRMPRF